MRVCTCVRACLYHSLTVCLTHSLTHSGLRINKMKTVMGAGGKDVVMEVVAKGAVQTYAGLGCPGRCSESAEAAQAEAAEVSHTCSAPTHFPVQVHKLNQTLCAGVRDFHAELRLRRGGLPRSRAAARRR